jgi:hypothetical protein
MVFVFYPALTKAMAFDVCIKCKNHTDKNQCGFVLVVTSSRQSSNLLNEDISLILSKSNNIQLFNVDLDLSNLK